MPYNSLVSRTDVGPLIPEDISSAMLTEVGDSSAVLRLGRRIPVANNQVRFPVLSALPTAYWVTGDTGLKQTTEMAWDNVYLTIEELAAIVPVPEAVLEDSNFDLWGAVRTELSGAIARALDAAVFFGTNAPASFPDDIVTSAAAAGNTVTRGANNQAAGGIAGDLSDLIGKFEADGYMANAAVATTTLRGRLRQNRDTTGQKLSEVSPDSFDGINIDYPMRGLWPSGSGTVEMIAGDFSKLVVGVRTDMTWKLLTESVIQDSNGDIIYNLSQQDMVALRVKFRAGWQVANPINYDQGVAANRYPFATLLAT